ncbi:hypothetical protein L208DRAFT_1399383, partial [Tricholoma matsutake]
GHTLALLVRTLIPLKSLVGIAERQWTPTLPLVVCIKAFSSAGLKPILLPQNMQTLQDFDKIFIM